MNPADFRAFLVMSTRNTPLKEACQLLAGRVLGVGALLSGQPEQLQVEWFQVISRVGLADCKSKRTAFVLSDEGL